jgi:hypothetical protein
LSRIDLKEVLDRGGAAPSVNPPLPSLDDSDSEEADLDDIAWVVEQKVGAVWISPRGAQWPKSAPPRGGWAAIPSALSAP